MLEMSACQLTEGIRREEFTSAQITQFFINRIEKYNSENNAVIDRSFEEAWKRRGLQMIFGALVLTWVSCSFGIGIHANEAWE